MSQSEETVPQELVADKYRLTKMIGRGGMGSVWEGVHATLGTRVAVKFIESEYVDSKEARSRFENEARAAAKLRSKHVVQDPDLMCHWINVSTDSGASRPRTPR